MKIKSFRAESVASALKQVREELGGDALVLKTKQLSNIIGGNRVEVTACLGHADEPQNSSSESSNAPVVDNKNTRVTAASEQSHDIIKDNKSLNEILSKLDSLERKLNNVYTQSFRNSTLTISSTLISKLQDADFTEGDISGLIGSVQHEAWSNSETEQTETLKQILVDKFASIMVPNLRLKSGDKVVFIGPAGAGKSSMLGKLAFHLVSQYRQKVTLASLDDFKIGSREEIASYADLLGVEMSETHSDSQNNDSRINSVTLIDSPSIPTDINSRNKLIEKIEQAAPTHRVLVFSATTRTSDIQEMMHSALSFCPTHLAISMTDLTNRYGAVLSANSIIKREIAFTTDAPGGVGSVKSPDPNAMVRRILRG